ncbi:MAG: portal protein [Bdellovibrio sp.]
MNTADDKSKKSEDEVLRIARERFTLAEEAEREVRELALEDLKFRAGEQWPDKLKNERENDGRPCLVINRIPQFVRQITNDQRQNRPSIKVSPVDDNADIETAKIFQGLIRHIENNSGADVAYDTAFESAVTSGFGYFRIITDYVSPESFEQEVRIEPIDNPNNVYLDPNSKKPDGCDANWGFVFSDIPKDDFTAEFGDSEVAKSNDWQALCDEIPGWITSSTVRVSEYFYKDFKTVDLVLLSNGTTVEKSQLPKELPLGVEVDKERTAKVPVIKWLKINGSEILEKTVFPGSYIPIIPVYGEKLNINGKKVLEGVIRHAKDPQRMYNYWKSTETETIALAPRAPFIVAEGQIPKEYEFQWATANRKNNAYLTYKPTTIAGQPVSAPQRQVFEPPVQAITQASMMAADDMKGTTGIYDAGLGAQSNEKSGIAIQRRNNQSQTSNFHFTDNLTRSLRHAGRILVEIIPIVYDTPQAVRIIGEDGEEEVIKINQLFEHKGKEVTYDLSAGKYDVTVETGPSYATKRQEALASMIELTRSYPKVAEVAGDLMVKNMDWPGSPEIAERLKKTLPPGLADDPKQQPVPPEAQAKMQQMDQMIQQLTAQLNQASDQIKMKSAELESKERIEMSKIEADLIKENAKLNSNEAVELLKQEIQVIHQRMQLLDFQEPIEEDFNESVPDQDEIHNEQQQPTGGFQPGQQQGAQPWQS